MIRYFVLCAVVADFLLAVNGCRSKMSSADLLVGRIASNQDDNILYIGGMNDKPYNNGSYKSSVDFKSISSNKTCHIKSLDYELAYHASAVTPIGVITCGGDILVAIDSNYPIVEQNYLRIEKINWRVGGRWESIDMSSFDRNDISFDGSCVTKWSEEDIIIIGGGNPWGTTKTWIMNIATMTVKPGPSLKTARINHGCARIRNDSIIVAAGGLGYGDFATSSEILKIGDLKWTNGPDTKESAFENRIVMSNQKDYVALSLGGTGLNDGSTSTIYGLNQDRNEWQVLGNVNGYHFRGSVVNVPSSMIPWCYD